MSFGLGRIYNRKSLWPAAQRELERQQLSNLDAADQAQYLEYCQVEESTDNPDEDIAELHKKSRPFGVHGLNYLDVHRIVRPVALSNEIVERYLDCICRYVNSVRRPVAAGVDHDMAGNEEAASRPETGYQAIEPMRTEASSQEKYLSCRSMTTEQFLQCTSIARATEVLEAMDLTGDNFKNLDYLFIAYGDGTHHALLGFAPRQKFVFVIDSVEDLIFLSDDLTKGIMMRILFSQLDRNETWPLYTQWPQKSEDTRDGSPNVARQRDMYNCGVFTLMNAWCLAFGFDLLCYRAQDLDPLKRPRMLMELLQGSLGGKYAYDLLDVPSGPLYMNPIQEAKLARNPGQTTVEQGIMDLISDDDEDGEDTLEDLNAESGPGPGAHDSVVDLRTSPHDTTSGQVIIDLDSDSDSSRDLEEAHGMVNGMECEIPPLDSMSRKLQKLIPSADREIRNDYWRRLPAMHEAWKAGREYLRVSEVERLAFPPQFNPVHFQKRGFLYPTGPGNASDGFLSHCNKTQRAAAYAQNSIYGLEKWQDEGPEIIDRWARNKMAAFAAMYWDESVRPDDCLLDGYDEWQSEHSAKERDAYRFLKEMWKREPNPDFRSRRDALYQFRFIREQMKEKGTEWRDLR